MLTITVPGREYYNEEQNRFFTVPDQELQLEHSLISLSKWESKWHIPFLNDNKRTKVEKTQEQLIDYIKCMTINSKNVDSLIYYRLTRENLEEINAYINDPMTATTFREDPNKPKINVNGTFTTAEILYYQMYELGIPNEWEKRHLNRLITLIRVISEKREQANNPKKMSKSELAKQNRALHAARRKPRIH